MSRSVLPSLVLSLLFACVVPESDPHDPHDADGDADADTDADADAETDTDTELGTIVDLASADPQLSTLVEALGDAGLTGTLAGPGPFTVFAPTNAAFDALGVDPSSLGDDELSAILLYHVVNGEVRSTGVPALANSASGLTLFFDTSDGVSVNGATVTTADIDASNGVIHVVDGVLLPPDLLDAVGLAGLTGLGDAVGAADPAVAELLAGPGPLTVFAPNNGAFDAISDVVEGLSSEALTDVLSYHVYAGALTSDALPATADSLLQNAWGYGVTALFDQTAGVVVNGSSTVVTADIRTTNGVIHIVDEVLLPPTVVDVAANAGLTQLLDAVGSASGDLGTVLSGPGPFTVFAPTNEAFVAATAITDALDPHQLADVLRYHVLVEHVPVVSSALVNGSEVPTLLGPTVTVHVVGSTVSIEAAEVVTADVHATNGVVHVIDGVLIPQN